MDPRNGMWCAGGVLSHYVVWVSCIVVGGKSWPWLAGGKQVLLANLLAPGQL